MINGTTTRMTRKNDVVDFDGINNRVVHYCVDNDLPYESSSPLAAFMDEQGDLDDVKLIKAFNDDKSPLMFRAKAPIPADAVTASASGLDPHISPRNADIQAARVARARGVPAQQVHDLAARHVEGRDLGFLGESRVNVLLLNLDLDRQFPKK